MRRLIAVCAPLLAAACASGSSARVDVRERFDAPPLSPVDMRFVLQPEHGRDANRYIGAARATLQTCGAWLGSFPRESLTLVDPAWHAAPADPGDAVVLERVPWWSAEAAMAPELSTARALSRRFVTEIIDTRGLPGWFVDGLAEYAARRAVAPIFEHDDPSPRYSLQEERYFHGFVPQFARMPLRVEADGGLLHAYRARPAVRAGPQVRSVDDAHSLAGKTVLALGTLERWLGRPVFDAVVADFVRTSRGGRPSIDDFEHAATRASGQDLAWFFGPTFHSSAAFDYGVERLTSEERTDKAYFTTVVVRRYGEAQFTGSSATPIGPFESGRGVTLLVVFADGQRSTDYWDGRSRDKVFRYRGPAQAVSASVDPDRTLLLDVNQTNNSRVLTSPTGTAATRWAARWMTWLENVLLAYSAFV